MGEPELDNLQRLFEQQRLTAAGAVRLCLSGDGKTLFHLPLDRSTSRG